MRMPLWCLSGALALSACGWNHQNITNPDQAGSLPAWSPCVVVHSSGLAQTVQFQEIAKLQRAGRITWIRLDAHVDGTDVPYHEAARSMGLRVFSIINLADLESYGWQQAFESVYRRYPSDIYEIAGEVTNRDPGVNPQGVTTPQYYMARLRDLYDYVRREHPYTVLTSAPTLGSAGGPAELETFFKAGLLDMDLVIAVNVYSSDALSKYAALFRNYQVPLAGHRVWVTETGVPNPAYQIDWVQRFYPDIQRTLNPEMTCFYSLWEGDIDAFNGYGMLDGVADPPLLERPLFRALTGPEPREP